MQMLKSSFHKRKHIRSSISFLGFLLLEELCMFSQTIIYENNIVSLAFDAKYLFLLVF